jgi:calcineurin-like phosphoesterase family protein
MKNRRLNKNSSTGFKGVYYDKKTRNFRATIWSDGKVYRLGRFASPQEAAEAYDEAAGRLHGVFGRQNPSA